MRKNNWKSKTSYGCALAIVVLLAIVVTQSAQAQTYTVIHTFTGADGADPLAGLTIDRGGNLYGTTYGGGAGSGTVYMLAHNGAGWIFSSLYSFAGGNDGAHPYGRVLFGRNGMLYGTTSQGGNSICVIGCGTVFNLKPPPNAICGAAPCSRAKTVLYRFMGTDGAGPSGDLVFDQAGNVYGTTFVGGGMGGNDGAGVVYKLTPAGVESVLYDFPRLVAPPEQTPLAESFSTIPVISMARPDRPVHLVAATALFFSYRLQDPDGSRMCSTRFRAVVMEVFPLPA